MIDDKKKGIHGFGRMKVLMQRRNAVEEVLEFLQNIMFYTAMKIK